MFGLGKPRSSLGKFLDQNDISQEWLSDRTGISRQSISALCDGRKSINPHEKTGIQIVGVLRRKGFDVEFADFWD